MTWVNLLKRHYLCVLDHYQSTPELLADPKIKTAYNALLSVKSVKDFCQWRRLMVDYGLAFTEMDDIDCKNNLLAVFDDYADGASEATIEAFVKWKLTFNPQKWGETYDWNIRLAEILYKATKRDEDVNIVIFPCGEGKTKRWAAIGQDADRLFEIFGWQTGHVDTESNTVSWMYINKFGFEVLQESGYNVIVRDLGEFDIFSTAFEEDSIASMQQFIDYLRMMNNITEEQVKFLRKIRPIIVPHPGYWELTHGSLVLDNGNVLAELEDGKTVMLASGKNWQLDKIAPPLLLKLDSLVGKA